MLTCEENNKAIERIIEVGYQQWYKETHPNYLSEKRLIRSIDDAVKDMQEWKKKHADV